MALELNHCEEILRQNMGTYKGSGFLGTKNGTFYLTNQRLIFATASKSVSFWLTPAAQFIPGSTVVWEIPLEKITSFGKQPKKINSWSYVITPEETYFVGFMSNDWLTYIHDAVKSLGKNVVVDGKNYVVQ